MTVALKRMDAAFRVKVARDFIKTPEARCAACLCGVNRHRGADHAFDPLRPLAEWTPEAKAIAANILRPVVNTRNLTEKNIFDRASADAAMTFDPRLA